MRKRNEKLVYAVAALLAVLILFFVVACAFFLLKQRVPKLNPVKAEAVNQTEGSAYEAKDVSQVFDGFTIGKGSTVNTAKDTAEETEEVNSDYICEASSERLLDESDIESIIENNQEIMPDDKPIPQMIVNEMYARYGYQFKNKKIQAYFDAKQWYQDIETPTSDMEKIYDQMTSIEKSNVDFLKEYQN